MTRRRTWVDGRLRRAGVLALWLAAGCGGGSPSKTGGKTDGGQTGTVVGGNLSATIDGVSWVSASNETMVSSTATLPGQLSVSGFQGSPTSYVSLSLALGYVAGPGTYPLGVNNGTTPGGTASVLAVSTTALTQWMTDFSGSRGSITFATLAAGRMTGTFLFTAPPVLGSTATNTRTVTDGAFDLPVPSTFTVPTGFDTGSTISATFNGQPWNGATVVGLGDTSTGVLSLGGTTTGITISIVTAMPVSAGGTYDQTAITFMATGSGSNCCWGGTGTTVSLTVTSLTANRAAGTFAATLPLAAGGSATSALTITGGAFDVRIDPAS